MPSAPINFGYQSILGYKREVGSALVILQVGFGAAPPIAASFTIRDFVFLW
ncbi:hypothetical protein [Heyndrickxia acidicola]|uniref:Uncharacterized protein n=1 Tax=Heyndrickxia acidicola TaxID=209389 RepID=A0ABU6MGZ0_9BACI|nr:hypothetical protein [Heyndrickxia acidicola]MED1203765.1 hypothetical protein [Heyndrickxia acidicola]